MIRTKLEKTGICTKKLNKLSYEIISNIQVLCFIQLNKIKEFQKIILEKFSNIEKIKKFIKYLKEYLFEINPHIYNYTELINYFKTNNSYLYLEKIYTTNNKVLSNDEIDKNIIKRKDYKTKTFLKIIEEEKFNDNLQWLSYEVFNRYLNKIIGKDIKDEKEIKNIINNIMDIKILNLMIMLM